MSDSTGTTRWMAQQSLRWFMRGMFAYHGCRVKLALSKCAREVIVLSASLLILVTFPVSFPLLAWNLRRKQRQWAKRERDMMIVDAARAEEGEKK